MTYGFKGRADIEERLTYPELRGYAAAMNAAPPPAHLQALIAMALGAKPRDLKPFSDAVTITPGELPGPEHRDSAAKLARLIQGD